MENPIKHTYKQTDTKIHTQRNKYKDRHLDIPRETNIRTDTKKIIQIGAATRTKIQKEF